MGLLGLLGTIQSLYMFLGHILIGLLGDSGERARGQGAIGRSGVSVNQPTCAYPRCIDKDKVPLGVRTVPCAVLQRPVELLQTTNTFEYPAAPLQSTPCPHRCGPSLLGWKILIEFNLECRPSKTQHKILRTHLPRSLPGYLGKSTQGLDSL